MFNDATQVNTIEAASWLPWYGYPKYEMREEHKRTEICRMIGIMGDINRSAG